MDDARGHAKLARDCVEPAVAGPQQCSAPQTYRSEQVGIDIADPASI